MALTSPFFCYSINFIITRFYLWSRRKWQLPSSTNTKLSYCFPELIPFLKISDLLICLSFESYSKSASLSSFSFLPIGISNYIGKKLPTLSHINKHLEIANYPFHFFASQKSFTILRNLLLTLPFYGKSFY